MFLFSYPHIVDGILEAVDYSTLLLLRQVCREFKDAISTRQMAHVLVDVLHLEERYGVYSIVLPPQDAQSFDGQYRVPVDPRVGLWLERGGGGSAINFALWMKRWHDPYAASDLPDGDWNWEDDDWDRDFTNITEHSFKRHYAALVIAQQAYSQTRVLDIYVRRSRLFENPSGFSVAETVFALGSPVDLSSFIPQYPHPEVLRSTQLMRIPSLDVEAECYATMVLRVNNNLNSASGTFPVAASQSTVRHLVMEGTSWWRMDSSDLSLPERDPSRNLESITVILQRWWFPQAYFRRTDYPPVHISEEDEDGGVSRVGLQYLPPMPSPLPAPVPAELGLRDDPQIVARRFRGRHDDELSGDEIESYDYRSRHLTDEALYALALCCMVCHRQRQPIRLSIVGSHYPIPDRETIIRRYPVLAKHSVEFKTHQEYRGSIGSRLYDLVTFKHDTSTAHWRAPKQPPAQSD